MAKKNPHKTPYFICEKGKKRIIVNSDCEKWLKQLAFIGNLLCDKYVKIF